MEGSLCLMDYLFLQPESLRGITNDEDDGILIFMQKSYADLLTEELKMKIRKYLSFPIKYPSVFVLFVLMLIKTEPPVMELFHQEIQNPLHKAFFHDKYLPFLKKVLKIFLRLPCTWYNAVYIFDNLYLFLAHIWLEKNEPFIDCSLKDVYIGSDNQQVIYPPVLTKQNYSSPPIPQEIPNINLKLEEMSVSQVSDENPEDAIREYNRISKLSKYK